MDQYRVDCNIRELVNTICGGVDQQGAWASGAIQILTDRIDEYNKRLTKMETILEPIIKERETFYDAENNLRKN
jgi:hypothetical protein